MLGFGHYATAAVVESWPIMHVLHLWFSCKQQGNDSAAGVFRTTSRSSTPRELMKRGDDTRVSPWKSRELEIIINFPWSCIHSFMSR
jgi:hypothetical protein